MSRTAPPTDRWLIAKKPLHARYPCTCWLGKACRTSGHPAYQCACWGRLDLEGAPAHCCAPGHPIHAKEAQPA